MGPYYQWWDAIETESGLTYHGIAATVESVHQTIRERGPFDVLIGFSQGAMLATILTALNQQPEALSCPPFSNYTGDLRPLAPEYHWKLVLLVGGMLPRDTNIQRSLLRVPPSIPSVHLYGAADSMLPLSKSLAEWWGSAGTEVTEVQHSEGHRFPSKPKDYEAVKQAFARQLGERVGQL